MALETAMPNTLKQSICALFEVHQDTSQLQRVVTPLEYPGTNDKVVVRVRERAGFYQIDENVEAALYASMLGGDTESETIERWTQELGNNRQMGVSLD